VGFNSEFKGLKYAAAHHLTIMFLHCTHTHTVLVSTKKKIDEKRTIRRPTHKWEDNINTLRTGDVDLRF